MHGGDAGLGVAVADGRLNGRGAAVPREERGVQIEAGQGRHFEKGFGQYLTIGHDDDEVGLPIGDRLQGLGLSDSRRLEDRQTFALRQAFDLGSGDDLLAAHRLVRLRDEADHAMIRVSEERTQGGQRDVSCAHEGDAQ